MIEEVISNRGACMGEYKLEQMTIDWVKQKKDNNEIRIPKVQRNLVWTKRQKQLLIDSLFKHYDIPKFHFRKSVENGKNIYYVIDGQQRLNAIFQFMQNEYEMPKDSDPVNGEEIANKKFGEISVDTRHEVINMRYLDIVYLTDYSDEEIDEMFLRLQNGTPLKPAEKRRAVKGEMKNVIKELAQNEAFEKLCDFKDEHFAFEDVTAKILKQVMNGLGGVNAKELRKFYEHNCDITINNQSCQQVKKAMNFLNKAFKKTAKPHLKKYSMFDLTIIVDQMLKKYDLNSHSEKFAKTYLQFLDARAKNSEKPEEKQDKKLIRYNNAARGDSLQFIE